MGVMAKNNIPTKKAFLFISFEVIITPQKVKETALKPVIQAFPKIFKNSIDSMDAILWVFLMYERNKKEASFYHCYFEAIGSMELVSDWTAEELQELQDIFLLIKSTKEQNAVRNYYKFIKPALKKFPEFFPKPGRFKLFVWAFKLVKTRAFSKCEGMLVPFADNLNHENVCIDYITLEKNFLSLRCEQVPLINDYKDFSGVSHLNPAFLMKTRSHKNRLEKYLAWSDFEKVLNLKAIWEIDPILCGLESSTDEEDQIHDWTSEESSESVGEDFDLHFDPDGKFFVMRTGENGSFKMGEQVYNCYGRLNNFDLLLDYGFCVYPNRYDSVHFRVAKNQIFFPSDRKVKFKTFNLKFNQLNLKFIKYIRKRSGKQEFVMQEIKVIEKFKGLVEEYYQIFPTLIEFDLESLGGPLPFRKKCAIRKGYLGYRVSQKEILLSQVEIANNLLIILHKIHSGCTVKSAHLSEKTVENIKIMYPLRKYLHNLEYHEL